VVPTLVNFYGSEGNFPDWAKVTSVLVGAALSVLAGLGYARERTKVKNEAMKAQTEKSKANADARAREAEAKVVLEEARVNASVAKRSSIGVLLISLCLVGLGCESFSLKAYDPITVRQIETTIEFETDDYRLSREALEEAEAEPQRLLELEIRHDAEIARLGAWKRAEEAKKIEDE